MGTILLFLGFVCFGAIVGGFIRRLPIGDDMFLKTSHCLKCGSSSPRIKSLIPIVSFLLRKNKCLECGEKIGFRYFTFEFINATVYGVLFLLFGLSLRLFYLSLLFSLLLAISTADLEIYEIPVILQMLLYVFALLQIILTPTDPLRATLRAIVYFIVIELLKITTERLSETEVIGGGDIKLIVVCGFMLNLEYMSIFLLFTGIFGAIVGFIWREDGKWRLFPLTPAILLSFYLLLIHQYTRL
jgi:leader peptidase (prepilin peptidase)/N-methyltransferase